eukprot:6210223-Pleurochrysis_carterae.AAC.3
MGCSAGAMPVMARHMNHSVLFHIKFLIFAMRCLATILGDRKMLLANIFSIHTASFLLSTSIKTLLWRGRWGWDVKLLRLAYCSGTAGADSAPPAIGNADKTLAASHEGGITSHARKRRLSMAPLTPAADANGLRKYADLLAPAGARIVAERVRDRMRGAPVAVAATSAACNNAAVSDMPYVLYLCAGNAPDGDMERVVTDLSGRRQHPRLAREPCDWWHGVRLVARA